MNPYPYPLPLSRFVFAKATVQEYRDELGPLAFLFWVEVFILLILLPWAALNGEDECFGVEATGAFWPYDGADSGSSSLQCRVIQSRVSSMHLSSVHVISNSRIFPTKQSRYSRVFSEFLCTHDVSSAS